MNTLVRSPTLPPTYIHTRIPETLSQCGRIFTKLAVQCFSVSIAAACGVKCTTIKVTFGIIKKLNTETKT